MADYAALSANGRVLVWDATPDDTDLAGSSNPESDTPIRGMGLVKVGTGAFSAAAMLGLLILLSIARRRRPYCYTGSSN